MNKPYRRSLRRAVDALLIAVAALLAVSGAVQAKDAGAFCDIGYASSQYDLGLARNSGLKSKIWTFDGVPVFVNGGNPREAKILCWAIFLEDAWNDGYKARSYFRAHTVDGRWIAPNPSEMVPVQVRVDVGAAQATGWMWEQDYALLVSRSDYANHLQDPFDKYLFRVNGTPKEFHPGIDEPPQARDMPNTNIYQDAHSGDTQTTYMVAGLAVVIGAGLLVWVIGVRSRRHQAAADKAAAVFNSNPLIVAARDRWPEDRFPRIAEPPDDALRNWQTILDRWPTPPATDIERVKNEYKFWRKWSVVYTDVIDDVPHLLPKQKAIDDFNGNERWLLREYFAATGIYIEPHAGPQLARLIEKMEEAERWYRKLEKYGPEMAARYAQRKEAEGDLKAARERLEEYLVNGKKAHTEKWGEWWFANIERAFKEKHAPQRAPVHQQPASGPANGVSDYSGKIS